MISKQQFVQEMNRQTNNIFKKALQQEIYDYMYDAVEKQVEFPKIFDWIQEKSEQSYEYCQKRVSTILSRLVPSERKDVYRNEFKKYYTNKKIQQNIKETLDEEEYKVLETVPVDFDLMKQQLHLYSLRDHVKAGEKYLCILLCTGLRKADIRQVQLQEVKDGCIYVKCLAKKQDLQSVFRIQVIFPEVAEKVYGYIREIQDQPDNYYYTNGQCKAEVILDIKTFLEITFGIGFCDVVLKKTCHDSAERINLHRLRSLYAYLMIYNKGFPEQSWIKEMKYLLHHETLDASMFYIKFQPAKFDPTTHTCFGQKLSQSENSSVGSTASTANTEKLQKQLQEKDDIIKNLLDRIKDLEFKVKDNDNFISSLIQKYEC